MSGRLAAPFWQADKFVVWNGVTWVLNEELWMNTCAEEANVGKNMERWLGWTVWEIGTVNLTPFMTDSQGKYILSSPNETYRNIIQRMIEIANYPAQKPGIDAPGITINIDLAFQYRKDEDDIARSPFRNNTLGTTDLYDPKNWPYFKEYMLWWFSLRHKKHPITGQPLKIKYSLGNEMLGDSLEFNYSMIREFDREKIWPFSWSICASVPNTQSGNDLFKRLPEMIHREGLFLWAPEMKTKYWDTNIYRPVHGCGEIRKGIDIMDLAIFYFLLHPILVRLSDDGCKRKPGVTWWFNAVRKICTLRGTDALTFPWEVQKPLVIVEHLPEDCDDAHVDVYAAMARAYAETFGPLENVGKWPDKWVAPVLPEIPDPPLPPDPPVPPAPPVKPLFSWKGEWNNNKGKILTVIGVIVLVIIVILVTGC